MLPLSSYVGGEVLILLPQSPRESAVWAAPPQPSLAGSLGWRQEENQGRAVQAGGLTAPRELSTLLQPPQAAEVGFLLRRSRV